MDPVTLYTVIVVMGNQSRLPPFRFPTVEACKAFVQDYSVRYANIKFKTYTCLKDSEGCAHLVLCWAPCDCPGGRAH